MNKIYKILLKIFLIVFIIICILISIFIYISKIKITDISEYVNKTNKYKIVFQAVGCPEWPFGRTKVKVTLVNSNNKKISSFEEYISDDGAVARESNINVNWYDEYVEITLMGGEQEDDIHQLKYRADD